MALTISVFRPDLFRIVLMSGDSRWQTETTGSFSGAWTRAPQDWEP